MVHLIQNPRPHHNAEENDYSGSELAIDVHHNNQRSHSGMTPASNRHRTGPTIPFVVRAVM
jgi:hypothetical protein